MKKKRSDCFLGIHFDFHAMPGQVVCERFDPDVIARVLDEIKPDFVQCDTKGHPGLSSYPTKVGNRAEVILADPLKTWRDLTRERGILLYGHHSGLFDKKAIELHPDWAVVNGEGVPSKDYISPFSPYADELLIPQLIELCDVYGLDGAWVDGECWGAKLDYGKYATEAYLAATGKLPPHKDEDGYDEYREFCREGFRTYVQKYVTALKEHDPEFEVTSNWMYSAYMPEPPSAHVDFLSGDYSSSNALESARFQSRCLAARGMTWDLMAWGQNAVPCSWSTHNRNTKEYAQYCQEASEVIALGGAFQFFNIMYGGGGLPQEWAIPMWKRVAEFCRERQSLCHGARQVKQVGILYCEAKSDHAISSLYTLNYPELTAVRGWINMLQDSQISSGVLYEYQLLEDSLSEYPVIILPAARSLKQESVSAIKRYVKNGGRVIVDASLAHLFTDISGAEAGEPSTHLVFIDGGDALSAAEASCIGLAANDGEVSGAYYDANFYCEKKNVAAVTNAFGNGKICTLAFDLGTLYMENSATATRKFCRAQLADVGFEPAVTVSGDACDYVDVVLTEKESKLLVNLVNYAGPHAVGAVRSYGQVPPLTDLTVKIKLPNEPRSVTVAPEAHTAKWSWDNGVLTVELDRLDMHVCIVAEL